MPLLQRIEVLNNLITILLCGEVLSRMERSLQMAMELENMLTAGEIDHEILDEVSIIVKELKNGKHTLNEYYRASTSHKLLEIFDEVNQKVKR